AKAAGAGKAAAAVLGAEIGAAAKAPLVAAKRATARLEALRGSSRFSTAVGDWEEELEQLPAPLRDSVSLPDPSVSYPVNFDWLAAGNGAAAVVGVSVGADAPQAYHMRYDFKPASVDWAKKGRYQEGEGGDVEISLPKYVEDGGDTTSSDDGDSGGAGSSAGRGGGDGCMEIFRGKAAPASDTDYLLIFDEKNKAYTLEKTAVNVTVKHVGTQQAQPPPPPPK
ncbi:unnamed protein product, partial [Phaeothamnion confervicola]